MTVSGFWGFATATVVAGFVYYTYMKYKNDVK